MTDDEQERHVITWYCSLRDCVFFCLSTKSGINPKDVEKVQA